MSASPLPRIASPSISTSPADFCAQSPPSTGTSRDPLPQLPASTLAEIDASSNSSSGSSLSLVDTNLSNDVDPQILEALKSKDRLYVLKLGELIENMIHDKANRIQMHPSTSYQRLLVHRCSTYYKCTAESEPGTKAIFVNLAAESCIPFKRISELVPAETATLPTFQIMRRTPTDRRSKTASRTGSVDGEVSDGDETGSLGGRSSASSKKKHMTIEEREAAYNEARTRIFNDFQEKEKAFSSNSSSLSVASTPSSAVSGSPSVSGVGSAHEFDETASAALTESDVAGPSTARDRNNSPAPHSVRPVVVLHSSNSSSTRGSASGSKSAGARNSASGSRANSAPGRNSAPRKGGSSRNSRAASPSSFQFPSLYDQPSAGMPPCGYDLSQPMPPYNGAQYYYPFSPPQPFMSAPYYYPHFAYAPSPVTYEQPPFSDGQNIDSQAQTDVNNASAQLSAQGYPASYPPSGGAAAGPYGQPYMWPHPGQPPPQSRHQRQGSGNEHSQHPTMTAPPAIQPPYPSPILEQPNAESFPGHTAPGSRDARPLPQSTMYPPYPGYMPPHMPPYPIPQPGAFLPQPDGPFVPDGMYCSSDGQFLPMSEGHQESGAMMTEGAYPRGPLGPGGYVPMSAPMTAPPLGAQPEPYDPRNRLYDPRNPRSSGAQQKLYDPRNGDMRPTGIPPRAAMSRTVSNASSSTSSSRSSSQSNRRGLRGPWTGHDGYDGHHGNGSNSIGLFATPMGSADAYGPRLNPAMRNKTNSLHSNGSSRDEVSSISSSTSSSSRRTYTSTTSSQSPHPLPPRPDWAVGLRPDRPGVLKPDHRSTPRSMNPLGTNNPIHAISGQHQHQQQEQATTSGASILQSPTEFPPLSQSNDFPPLRGGTSPSTKRAVTSGAWTNVSSTRSILRPAGSQNSPGNSPNPASGPTVRSPISVSANGISAHQPSSKAAAEEVSALTGQMVGMSLASSTGSSDPSGAPRAAALPVGAT